MYEGLTFCFDIDGTLCPIKKKEEEYIDLVPILKNLYFDADKFLSPIKGVEVVNG